MSIVQANNNCILKNLEDLENGTLNFYNENVEYYQDNVCSKEIRSEGLEKNLEKLKTNMIEMHNTLFQDNVNIDNILDILSKNKDVNLLNDFNLTLKVDEEDGENRDVYDMVNKMITCDSDDDYDIMIDELNSML